MDIILSRSRSGLEVENAAKPANNAWISRSEVSVVTNADANHSVYGTSPSWTSEANSFNRGQALPSAPNLILLSAFNSLHLDSVNLQTDPDGGFKCAPIGVVRYIFVTVAHFLQDQTEPWTVQKSKDHADLCQDLNSLINYPLEEDSSSQGMTNLAVGVDGKTGLPTSLLLVTVNTECEFTKIKN